MKKSLLNLAVALCIGLFASCSQEEIISGSENRVETVSVSAQLPGDAVQTRAIPGAAANHQLRCILEVWNKSENTLIERIEKLETEATGGKLQFTFNVPSATDYECLLWADFIASDATATEGKYADKYYTTTSLKTIDFKVTDAGLFNNESVDAFCGVVAKNGSVNNLSVTLKRPFTRVTLKDNSNYLASVTSLAPSFDTPSKFDVSTGKAVGYTTISATGITPTGTDNKTLFSTFIFASADKTTLDKDVKIVFTKTEGGTEEKTIKAGQISLDQNVKNDVTADYAADGTDVTVDVDIDDQYPDPNALKIGQFVNKDGSVSDTYNAETTCGIIFAVGAQGDDIAANYTGFESKTIAGYAMALSNVEGKPFSAEPDMPAESQEAALTSFSGMKLTNGILSYIETNSVDAPLFTNFITWKTDNATTGTNLSAWYVPSYQQLVTFVGYIYGTPTGNTEADPAFPANIAKNETFSAAVTSANAGDFLGTATTRNILSSSFTTAKKAACVQFTRTTEFKTVVPGKLINAFSMRPVLTVFKAE